MDYNQKAINEVQQTAMLVDDSSLRSHPQLASFMADVALQVDFLQRKCEAGDCSFGVDSEGGSAAPLPPLPTTGPRPSSDQLGTYDSMRPFQLTYTDTIELWRLGRERV